jgi:uncharacterized RDD family membrane protein YckC
MTEEVNPTQLSEFEESLLVPSLGRRFLNYLLDFIFINIISYVLLFILGFVAAMISSDIVYEMQLHPQVLGYSVYFLVYFAYYIFFEANTGKTIAKFYTKTKVCSLDGTALSYKRIIIRTLCRLIPFDNFSFFFIEDNKGWHDVFSKTKVVKDS